MPVLSAFQCLPLHIAKKIATYYICALKANGSNLAWRTDPHVWTTLYNVSYSWHVLALQYFLDKATLNISTEHPSGQLRYYNLPKNIALDSEHYNYVSSVFISYSEDVPLIEKKTFIERLLAAWPVNIVFPFARFLTINLGSFMFENDDTGYPFDNKQLQLLYWRIQATMPKLQDISFEDSGFMQTIANVLSGIHNRARLLSINRDNIQLANSFLFSSAETGLTHIDCTLSNKNNTFSHIIKSSAPTLESLTYDSLFSLELKTFFLDNGNNPIVYPRLQELYIGDMYNNYPLEKIQIDKRIVLFPALRQLTWRPTYIFEDDAMFRDNINMLEYLAIDVDARLAKLLETHKVFSNGRYSKLQYISFNKVDFNEGQTFSDERFENIVVDSIGPETKFLQHSIRRLNNINSVVHKIQFMENIQVLSLTRFKGKVSELLDAIRLLPNLTKLQCASGSFDYRPYSMQFKEFIDDYHKKHYPLSQSFRRWDVKVFCEDNTGMAHTGLAFSILCPNFALISVDSGYEEDYKSEIRKTLECGLFNKYSDSIKPLLKHKQSIDNILGNEDV